MLWVALSVLILMSSRPFGRPPWATARPQGGRPVGIATVAVATSPPSVTDAPEAAPSSSDAAAATGADTVATTFLYPPGSLPINYLDSVQVQYTSPWQDVKLVVACEGEGVSGSKQFDVDIREYILPAGLTDCG
jgi:hypothetical protein